MGSSLGLVSIFSAMTLAPDRNPRLPDADRRLQPLSSRTIFPEGLSSWPRSGIPPLDHPRGHASRGRIGRKARGNNRLLRLITRRSQLQILPPTRQEASHANSLAGFCLSSTRLDLRRPKACWKHSTRRARLRRARARPTCRLGEHPFEEHRRAQSFGGPPDDVVDPANRPPNAA